MDTWDSAELDARLAAAERRRPAPAVFPANACSPKLLRLPGEPGTPRPRPRRPTAWLDATTGATTPAEPSAAWFAEVRRLRRAGLVSELEARDLLGLPPLSTSRQLRRLARRALRYLRRVRWL